MAEGAKKGVRIHVARNGQVIGEFDEFAFREKITKREILATDHYFAEGAQKDWKPVYEYRPPSPPLTHAAPAVPTGKKRFKFHWTKLSDEKSSPGATGTMLAVTAALLPLLHPSLFFLLSLPMLLAAFVLSIVSITKGRVTVGVLLLIGLLPAFFMALAGVIDRDKILHHPAELRKPR